MTVTSTTSRWEAVGNGSTTVFPYNNKIFEDTDLKVYLDGVLQTLTTHYTVSGAGTDSGGNVTFGTAPASGVSVVIVRAVANTQEIDYPPGGAFPANSTEDGLDRRTIISQQNVGTLGRAIQYLESDASLPSPILPTLSTIKGKYLKFNSVTGAPEAGIFDTGTASRTVQYHSGDNTTTGFTLSPAAATEAFVDVYISGVHQAPSAYTVSGSSLIFSAPPPAGTNNIIVVISEEVPIGSVESSSATYLSVAGSTSRSVQSRLRDIVTVKDFGAVGDGSTDDTAAIQAALDSATEQVFFPEGVYKITAALTITNKHKHLFGFGPMGGTEIRQVTNAANGLVVSHTGPYRLAVTGLKLGAQNELSGTGLKVSYNDATLIGFRLSELVRLTDIVVTGYDDNGDAGSWDTCVELSNVNRPKLTRCHFRGRRDLTASVGTEARYWKVGATGLSVLSPTNQQPVNMNINDCQFRNLEVPLVTSGDMEGINIHGSYFVNCKYGPDISYVAVAPDVDANDPGLHLVGCHINCLKWCVRVTGASEVFIAHNEFYRFPFVDSEDWICMDLSSVDRSVVSDNTILGNSAVGTPGYMKGVRGANTKRTIFKGNNFFNLTAGGGSDSLIEFLDNGCTDNIIVDNYDTSTSTTPTLPMVTYSGTSSASLTRAHGLTGGPFITDSATGVTVAGTATTIDGFSLPAARAVPGAQFRIRASFTLVKGGTAGSSEVALQYITSTGTGSFETSANSIGVRTPGDHALSTTWRAQVDGIWTVATAGGTTIALQGTSAGSNSTGSVWYTVEQIR